MTSAATPDGVSVADIERELGLARQLVLRDRFHAPLRTVAGFQFGRHGDVCTASAVLLEADTLELIASRVARLPVAAPADDPRGSHAVPALLAALALLPLAPDLALVEAHGIAHPRRLGTAAHFGLASDLACIGVATAIDVGATRISLHEMRGAFTPLRDGPQQVGWLLRSQPDAPPLVVSPGHRMSMASAPELVMRFVTGDRRPEPTRLARALLDDEGLAAAEG